MSAIEMPVLLTCVLCWVSLALLHGHARSEDAPGSYETPELLLQKARPRIQIPGMPKESDVVMRSLTPRPRGEDDPHDTLEAIRGFHVTWLEWTYGGNKEFTRRVNELGATFGGAAGAASYSGQMPREEWLIRDRKGNITYHWLRPPHPAGCANHPEFRAGHLRYMKNQLDIGAVVIQRDEAHQNKWTLSWGGCFCDYCMDGFNEWLKKNSAPDVVSEKGITDLDNFDYREYLDRLSAPVGRDFYEWEGDQIKDYYNEFQEDSTLEFNKWWRRELNEYAGRHVPVSCNNGVQTFDCEISLVFDYWIGELSADRRHANPEYLYHAVKRAEARGTAQKVTMPLYAYSKGRAPDARDESDPMWVRHNRQSLATMYALGSHMEMPWDTYLPTQRNCRFFGEPEDYADLSAFVRAMSDYLDGYADAAATGGDIKDERWSEDEKPVAVADGGSLYAFTRVKPEDPDSPVVVHLLDWRADPEPFLLNISSGAFYGDRPLRFSLFLPAPYEQEAHERAFETGYYGGMAEEQMLAEGYITSVEIPALHPWGMLIVEPLISSY